VARPLRLGLGGTRHGYDRQKMRAQVGLGLAVKDRANYHVKWHMGGGDIRYSCNNSDNCVMLDGITVFYSVISTSLPSVL